MNRYEKQKDEEKAAFVLVNDSEKVLSRQSTSETKPKIKLVLKLFHGKKLLHSPISITQ